MRNEVGEPIVTVIRNTHLLLVVFCVTALMLVASIKSAPKYGRGLRLLTALRDADIGGYRGYHAQRARAIRQAQEVAIRKLITDYCTGTVDVTIHDTVKGRWLDLVDDVTTVEELWYNLERFGLTIRDPEPVAVRRAVVTVTARVPKPSKLIAAIERSTADDSLLLSIMASGDRDAKFQVKQDIPFSVRTEETLQPWLKRSPAGRLVLDAAEFEAAEDVLESWNELHGKSLWAAIDYLEPRSRESRESTILGIDLTPIAAGWTVPLVTSLLLFYIAAHLRQLVLYPCRDADRLRWVGLFDDLIAMSLTTLSLFVLPVIVNLNYFRISRYSDPRVHLWTEEGSIERFARRFNFMLELAALITVLVLVIYNFRLWRKARRRCAVESVHRVGRFREVTNRRPVRLRKRRPRA